MDQEATGAEHDALIHCYCIIISHWDPATVNAPGFVLCSRSANAMLCCWLGCWEMTWVALTGTTNNAITDRVDDRRRASGAVRGRCRLMCIDETKWKPQRWSWRSWGVGGRWGEWGSGLKSQLELGSLGKSLDKECCRFYLSYFVVLHCTTSNCKTWSLVRRYFTVFNWMLTERTSDCIMFSFLHVYISCMTTLSTVWKNFDSL